MIKEIGFLKRREVSRSDGQSPSVFKVAGEVLKSEVTKFLGSFRNGKRFLRIDVDRPLYRFTRKVLSAHVKVTEKIV